MGRESRRVGRILQERACSLGKSDADLAKLLDCSEVFIRRLYAGRVYLGYKEFAFLAQELGMSVSEILDTSNEEFDEGTEFILDIIEDYLDILEAI